MGNLTNHWCQKQTLQFSHHNKYADDFQMCVIVVQLFFTGYKHTDIKDVISRVMINQVTDYTMIEINAVTVLLNSMKCTKLPLWL